MKSDKTGECPEILKSFFISLPESEPVPGYPIMSLPDERGGYLK